MDRYRHFFPIPPRAVRRGVVSPAACGEVTGFHYAAAYGIKEYACYFRSQ